MKKIQVKVFLKRENKGNLYIFFVPYHGVPYL